MGMTASTPILINKFDLYNTIFT